MATTSDSYTGNGSTVLFSFSFPYLDTADIKVSLNGVDTTAYTLDNATKIRFNTAPASGVAIKIYRVTNSDQTEAEFYPGSAIRSSDLNRNFLQTLYVSQETQEVVASSSSAGLQSQITAANNTANTAISTANTANATANGIAGTANTALANANDAVTTANSATSSAAAANSTANAIAGTANTALTNSITAVSAANTAQSTANTAVSTANTAVSTANTAVTTANAALPLAGGTMTGVITYATAQPRLLSGTVNAGGTTPFNNTLTAVDFTGIPSWVKRITMMLDAVSTSLAGIPTIRIGTASGIENTGYTSGVSNVATSSAATQSGVTSGFELVTTGVATYTYAGQYILTNITGNIWILTGSLHVGGTVASQQFTSGRKAVASTLTRIQLTTTAGADTFDGGSVNIMYEG
jgi:hypothetical protein